MSNAIWKHEIRNALKAALIMLDENDNFFMAQAQAERAVHLLKKLGENPTNDKTVYRELFMARFRGISANKVANALNKCTAGINWIGCAKGHMADEWALAQTGHHLALTSRLRKVSLDTIEGHLIQSGAKGAE